MTRDPIDVDAEIQKTVDAIKDVKGSYKLLPVKRDTYLGWQGYPGFVDFLKDLDLSRDETVKLLIILSGVKKQLDMTNDERVRAALRQLGKSK